MSRGAAWSAQLERHPGTTFGRRRGEIDHIADVDLGRLTAGRGWSRLSLCRAPPLLGSGESELGVERQAEGEESQDEGCSQAGPRGERSTTGMHHRHYRAGDGECGHDGDGDLPVVADDEVVPEHPECFEVFHGETPSAL